MKFFLIGVFLFVFCVSAAGQNRSLDYYLQSAIAQSPAIQEQQNLVSASELQKDIVKAELTRPFISGTADYLYAPTFGNFGYDLAVTNGGLYSALLNIDYPLITGKRKTVREREAKTTGQKATFQQQLLRHELRRSVTSQYITAYQDAAQVQYLNEIMELLARQKKTLKDLARQGLARITDLRQIEIEIQKLQVDRKSVENSYRNNLAQLNVMSGLTDTSGVTLSTPELITKSKVETSRFLRQFRLDSLQLAMQQQVSELKYQPSLSAFGNTGLNTTKFSGLDNNYGFSAGLRFSVPIYDGRQKSITRQQTKLAINSVESYQQRFNKERQNNLASLRFQLRQANEQRTLLNDQINRYEQLLKTYRDELSRGEFSIINYLTVLRSYIDARNQQVQVQGNRLNLINAYNYWNW